MLSPAVTVGYMWSPEYLGEEGAYNKVSAKLGLSLFYSFGLEIEAAHVESKAARSPATVAV